MVHEIVESLLLFLESIWFIGPLIGALGALIILWLFLYIRRRWDSYRRAVKWYQKGHPARAHMLLRIALEKNTGNKQALLLKSDLESETGKFADAEKGYFRLIDLKQQGDGIDTFEVKKKLLRPLLQQEKLSDSFRLCTDILSVEKSNAEALYHLGLIYLGQLYYAEAHRIFSLLLKNRPRFFDAHFVAAVTAVQLRRLDAAIGHIQMVIDEGGDFLARLVLASIHFFKDNAQACLIELKSIPAVRSSFEKPDQYRYFLKLQALCHYLLEEYQSASTRFEEVYGALREGPGKRKGSTEGKAAVIYDQFGRRDRLETDAREAEGAPEDAMGGAASETVDPAIQRYYRLKEVAREHGKRGQPAGGGLIGSNAILDIEGLTEKTWVALGLAFSLFRERKRKEALELLRETRRTHPELLGLGKIIDLVQETLEEGQRDRNDGAFSVSGSTRKIVEKKRGRFELWEYIDAWTRGLIRPYQLVQICGFSSKKQLSHGLLFGKESPYHLLFR